MLRITTIAVIVLGLLTTQACSPMADGIATKYCQSDADCGGTFVCVYGACYDPGSASFQRVSFEVVPSSATPLPSQQFANLPINLVDRTVIALEQTIHVEFEILDTDATPVVGLLTAQTQSDIPGHTLRDDDRMGLDGHARLTLISGKLYQLRVLPDDVASVPFRPDPILANSDVDGRILPLYMQADETLMKISGRIVIAADNPRGVIGQQVQIFGPINSLGELGVVSSTQVSDADGAFEVLLPAENNSGLTLRVTPTSVNPMVPSIEKNQLNFTGDTELGFIEVGHFGTPLEVVGVVNGPNGPLAGAVITFSGAAGFGTIAVTATTDQQGKYQIYILPGAYDTMVVPPLTSRAGLTTSSEPVIFDQMGTTTYNLSVQPRAFLAGTLRTHIFTAISMATIRATRLGNADEETTIGASIHSVFETRSDDDGNYELQLDPGVYEITVIPPAGAILPRKSDIVVVGVTDSTHDIQLSKAAPIGGKTVRANGEALPGALVRSYFVLNDSITVLLGEEICDQEGLFSLVLPAIAPSQ